MLKEERSRVKWIDGKFCLLHSPIVILSACGGGGGGGDKDNKGPPTAISTLNPSVGYAPLTASFDAAGSHDIDGIDFLATINSGLSGSTSSRLSLPKEGIPVKTYSDRQ